MVVASLNALILGAGIAGPTMALALERAGIEPEVFEAHDKPADHTGLFLNTASNGLDALRIDSYAVTDNGVVARFTDGTDASGDILIGADGIHSRTRQLADPDAPRPRFTGMLSIGGFSRVPCRRPMTSSISSSTSALSSAT